MEKFYSILVHLHSGWRWVVLILLLAAIFKAFSGWRGRKEFTPGDRKLALFTMIAFHLQFLFGMILYFLPGSTKVNFSEFMKNSMLRFFTLEHIALMTIGMILLTIGYSRAKRMADNGQKFKTIFVFYLITLIVVLISIPWPFREGLMARWF